jgi:large subunit ribosomal protein L21
LLTRLVEAELVTLPADIYLASEKEIRNYADQAIREAAEKDGPAFHAVLKEVVATAPSEAPSETPAPPTPDRLEDIKGIGPVFAGRLNAAGVVTFDDLAALTPEQVTDIVAADDESEHLVDAESWIAQARALAEARVRSGVQAGYYFSVTLSAGKEAAPPA